MLNGIKMNANNKAIEEFFEISRIIREYSKDYEFVRVIDHSKSNGGLKIEVFINWKLVKAFED